KNTALTAPRFDLEERNPPGTALTVPCHRHSPRRASGCDTVMAWRRSMLPETSVIGLFQHSGDLSLATDLYELTMAAAFFEQKMAGQAATFELFVRHLPPERGYLVVAGLEQAIQYLTCLRFDTAALSYLRSLPVFE